MKLRVLDLIPSGRLAVLHLHRRFRPQHPPGHSVRFQKVLVASLIHDLSTVYARFRSHIHNVIRQRDDFPVVFHNHHGISVLFQLDQRIFEILDIARMQSDARLIQHIHHIGKRRIDVTRDLDTLRLAAGESVCSTA